MQSHAGRLETYVVSNEKSLLKYMLSRQQLTQTIEFPLLYTKVFSASYRQLEMTYMGKASESISSDLTPHKYFLLSTKKIPIKLPVSAAVRKEKEKASWRGATKQGPHSVRMRIFLW